jgi:hypothetical protein
MPNSRPKTAAFVVITVLCVGVAVVYTIFAARRAPSTVVSSKPVQPGEPVSAEPSPPANRPPDVAGRSTGTPAAPVPSPAPESAQMPEPVLTPYLVAINVRDSPELGRVEFFPADAVGRRTTTSLSCERVYFANTIGICLTRRIRFMAATTVATVVDASFKELFSVVNEGIPSRARVSPDERYASFTVFVAGHSYADAYLSTATILIDLPARSPLGNLEDFDVVQMDGTPLKAPDFNYWGVTFAHDSNLFYATLRTGGAEYLVRGDIRARRVVMLRKGVECPSLSPDETRIAFKKMVARGQWRLSVLDVRTLEEKPLAETRSVDDQVEWLDDSRVLYGMLDPAPWVSIMVVPADGSGAPSLFAKGASSPAVARRFAGIR